MAPDLHDKLQKSRHIMLCFDGARRESGLGAAAWILWLPDEYCTFENVSYGGRVLRNASAMIGMRFFGVQKSFSGIQKTKVFFFFGHIFFLGYKMLFSGYKNLFLTF